MSGLAAGAGGARGGRGCAAAPSRGLWEPHCARPGASALGPTPWAAAVAAVEMMGVWQRQSLRLAGRSRAGAAWAQAAPRALPWKRLGFCGFVNAVTAPPALPAVREGKEPTLSYTGATSVLMALMQLDAILAL